MNHQMDENLKDFPKLQHSCEEEGEKMKSSSSSSLSSEHDVVDHDDEMIEEGEIFEGSHKCIICDKTFKTAQALGGHRRSHIFQALKKKSNPHFSNFSKQGIVRANFNDNDDDDVGHFDDHEKTFCYICNKKFPTKNALYGHMKSHPKRVSKALNNSSSAHNSNSSMDQDDGFVAKNEKKKSDLQKTLLPKWKNKNKRGKRCGAMSMAAKVFMTMPKDNNFSPKVPLPFKKRKFEIGESSEGKELQPVKKIRAVYHDLMMFGKKNDVADGGGESGSSGLSESRVAENKVMKNKSKTYDPVLGGYKCSLCGKCFSNFQGLGGHKSGHKKYGTSICVNESNISDVVPVVEVQENNSSSSNVVSVADAQENNSSSTNVSGVADAQENSSSNITSENVPKVEEEKAVIEKPFAESSGQKKYEFDLNEPYVMQD